MKKIKNMFNNNKILFILTSFILVCIIIIFVGLLTTFYKSTSKSKYGSRLDDLSNVKITKNFIVEYTSGLEKEELISKVNVDVKGKIIYIIVVAEKDAPIENIKSLTVKSLENFREEELKKYDINFIVNCKEKTNFYPTMGYKDSSSDEVSWANVGK